MDRLLTHELTKVYNRVPVVDHINLEFAAGEVTALLGRNGAGKTTTFLMMAGIVKPDQRQRRAQRRERQRHPLLRALAEGADLSSPAAFGFHEGHGF